jgi:hypothetical protein
MSAKLDRIKRLGKQGFYELLDIYGEDVDIFTLINGFEGTLKGLVSKVHSTYDQDGVPVDRLDMSFQFLTTDLEGVDYNNLSQIRYLGTNYELDDSKSAKIDKTTDICTVTGRYAWA